MRSCSVKVLCVTALLCALPISATDSATASATAKIHHIESNGASAHPDPAPTTLTAREIDAYVASKEVELPRGVQSVRFASEPGIVTATSRVDFDAIKNGRESSNPLLSIFGGVHQVVVVAHAKGLHGQGIVHVDSVSLDGTEIPRFILELFVEHYLKPRYPEIGLDSQFRLQSRIDNAIVGSNQVTLVQK